MSFPPESSEREMIPCSMSVDGGASEHNDTAPISLAEASMHLSVRAVCGMLFGMLIWGVLCLCLVGMVRLVPGMESLVGNSWALGFASRIGLGLWLAGWLVFSLASLYGSLVKLVRSFWWGESPKQRWCALAMHVLIWPLTLYQAIMVVVCLLCLVTGEEMGS